MKNQLQQLLDAGQSVWIDNLRRSMFASGELKRMIERGLRGMTSNPTIFEKAIGAGNDYDDQLRQLVGSEKNAEALFWDLAIADIQHACDEFAPVYQSSGGNDGFVSLEVSPLLARETQGTIAMAKELWARVGRPNLMVKIPGTKEGLPAIEECIYEGVNINVTLIFSVDMYEKAARAYVKGLQRRIAENKPIDTIRSVNSVFVSRIDSAVDKMLHARIAKGEKLEPLLGKTGIANFEAYLSEIQRDFPRRRVRAGQGRGRRGSAPVVGFDVHQRPALSRPHVRRERRRARYREHHAAADARCVDRSREHRSRHRRNRSPRRLRHYEGAAGRENLAVRRDRATPDGGSYALLRLVCRIARRHRLQAEASRGGRSRPRPSFARPLAAVVRQSAGIANVCRLPHAPLGARSDPVVERARGCRDHQEIVGMADNFSSTCSNRSRSCARSAPT